MSLLTWRERAACKAIIQQHSRSFYLSALLLPPRVRDGAFALYAFCRLADDAVDEAPDDPLARVAALRARLAAIYQGGELPHLVDRAFARVVEACGIPRAVPEALLAGMAADAAHQPLEDETALLRYAFEVAGTVGIMMALLMEARSEAALLRAVHLGVAMQLTNICRDVGEDARLGRVYLPRTLCCQAGLEQASLLRSPVASPGQRAVVRHLLAQADAHYRAAEGGLALLPPTCRLAIAASRHIYAEIGRAIEANACDVMTRRAVVPTRRKLGLLGRAALTAAAPGPLVAGPAEPQLRAWLAELGLLALPLAPAVPAVLRLEETP